VTLTPGIRSGSPATSWWTSRPRALTWVSPGTTFLARQPSASWAPKPSPHGVDCEGLRSARLAAELDEPEASAGTRSVDSEPTHTQLAERGATRSIAARGLLRASATATSPPRQEQTPGRKNPRSWVGLGASGRPHRTACPRSESVASTNHVLADTSRSSSAPLRLAPAGTPALSHKWCSAILVGSPVGRHRR
jgi:hypothetical protein